MNKNKKILITGGMGFIGSAVAEELIKVGYKVKILDNLYRKGSETNIKKFNRLFHQLDIRDNSHVKQI